MHIVKTFAVSVGVLLAVSGCRERASVEPPAGMDGGVVGAHSVPTQVGGGGSQGEDGGADPSFAPPDDQGAAEPTELPRFALGDGRELRIILGSCDSSGCPLSVALFERGVLRSSEALHWPVAEPVFSQKPAERGEGVGDPLEAPPLQAWTSGEEERSVTSIFQLVRLDGGTPGLLVAQTGGFEHVKRHQALYVVQEDEVVRVWEAMEGSGPTLSTVALVPSGQAQVLASFSGFIHPDESEPEAWTAQVMRWNPSGSRMEPVAPGGLVHVLALGNFRSARAARAARESAQECLGQFWVLPARPLGVGGRFTLAVMSTRAGLIDSLALRTRECAPNLTQQKIAPKRFGPSH